MAIVAYWAKPLLWAGPWYFPIKIYSYGFAIAWALGACWAAFTYDLNRLKIKKVDAAATNLFFIVGFYLGSKIHTIASAIAAGQVMTLDMWKLESGHSFMGSAIGGALCGSVYCRYCGYELLPMLDILVPLVPLGHGIGKWGCLLSGDGCYGPPAPGLAWAVSFPRGQVPTKEFVHPTPLYESFLSLTLFFFMFFKMAIPAEGERPRHVGTRAGACIIFYGVERIVVEPFRRHPALDTFMGMTEYQALAVVMAAMGAFVMYLGRHGDPWPRMFAPDLKFLQEEAQSKNKAKKKQ